MIPTAQARTLIDREGRPFATAMVAGLPRVVRVRLRVFMWDNEEQVYRETPVQELHGVTPTAARST